MTEATIAVQAPWPILPALGLQGHHDADASQLSSVAMAYGRLYIRRPVVRLRRLRSPSQRPRHADAQQPRLSARCAMGATSDAALPISASPIACRSAVAAITAACSIRPVLATRLKLFNQRLWRWRQRTRSMRARRKAKPEQMPSLIPQTGRRKLLFLSAIRPSILISGSSKVRSFHYSC